VHRSSQWLINTDVGWRGSDSEKSICDNLKWQREVHTTFSRIQPTTGSYQNFPDPGLDNHAEAYWGDNLSTLLKLKACYDPDAVFTPPRHQGISPNQLADAALECRPQP
jgi:hypothetical protein